MGSKSARALAQNLEGSRQVYPDRNYRPYRNHLIINWGNSTVPEWYKSFTYAYAYGMNSVLLNPPECVRRATNKLKAFEILHECGIPVPDFTTSRAVAQGYLSDGHTVVVRTLLNSHSGRGIVLVNEGEEIPQAPLYVKYIKKNKEFRVHVFNGEILDIQQKKKVRDREDVDYQIRNHENGWVYCRDAVADEYAVATGNIGETAIKAVEALGLDFGAVDIIYNDHQQQEYVLEINTAPGLHGTTLEKYVNAIKELV